MSNSSFLWNFLGLQQTSFSVYHDDKFTFFISAFSVLILLFVLCCVFLCIFLVKKRHDGEVLSQKIYSDFLESHHHHQNSSSSSESYANLQPPEVVSEKKGNKKFKDTKVVQKVSFAAPTISIQTQSTSTEKVKGRRSGEWACVPKFPVEENKFYPQLHSDTSVPRISFSLNYQFTSQLLIVKLLSGANFSIETPHYIQVKVYPGASSRKNRTKIFNEEFPIFNAEYLFYIKAVSLLNKVLRLRAVANTIPSKFLVGSLNISLSDLEEFSPASGKVVEDLSSPTLWRTFEKPAQTKELQMKISIKWENLPSPGILTIKIIEAIGLHEINHQTEYTTSYVKVTLREQDNCIKSRKTRIIRWGSMPNYNETFVVNLPHELLKTISFLIELVARDRLGSKVVLGRVLIGLLNGEEEEDSLISVPGKEIWTDMIRNRNTEILKAIPLV